MSKTSDPGLVFVALLDTYALAYSPTRFSEKFVFPCSEMMSMKSNGFEAWYILAYPSASARRSATNSMYCDMSLLFMPMSSTRSASLTNSFSHRTASSMISCTRSAASLLSSMPYMGRQSRSAAPRPWR